MKQQIEITLTAWVQTNNKVHIIYRGARGFTLLVRPLLLVETFLEMVQQKCNGTQNNIQNLDCEVGFDHIKRKLERTCLTHKDSTIGRRNKSNCICHVVDAGVNPNETSKYMAFY